MYYPARHFGNWQASSCMLGDEAIVLTPIRFRFRGQWAPRPSSVASLDSAAALNLHRDLLLAALTYTVLQPGPSYHGTSYISVHTYIHTDRLVVSSAGPECRRGWPDACRRRPTIQPEAHATSPSPGAAFANIPAPRPEHLDHLRRDRRRQRHSHKDEALVDCVGERQLRRQTCRFP